MRNFDDRRVAQLTQYRAIKTACHELCHVFSMKHCQAYECLMNGSSQIDEADRKPFALCAVCLRKLSLYLGFEGSELERYEELRTHYLKLMSEDLCFDREVKLFDRIVKGMKEVQEKWAKKKKVGEI